MCVEITYENPIIAPAAEPAVSTVVYSNTKTLTVTMLKIMEFTELLWAVVYQPRYYTRLRSDHK